MATDNSRSHFCVPASNSIKTPAIELHERSYSSRTPEQSVDDIRCPQPVAVTGYLF